MQAPDFDSTPDKVAFTIAQFRSLLEHPGWKLFQEEAEFNIELLKEEIVNGFEGETKEITDRLRDKLKVHQEMIGRPAYWIKKLQPVESEEVDYDPFPS